MDTALSHLEGHLAAVNALSPHLPVITAIGLACVDAIRRGNKILFFGNGGSAADAQHFATELVVRYVKNRRALPSLALTVDTSSLTACGNDFGFEEVFARQIDGLGAAGDVAVGITTSGSSPNVLRGLEAAKQKGCVTVALTGEMGARLKETCDFVFTAPSSVTAHIQECHLIAGHILCAVVENAFADG